MGAAREARLLTGRGAPQGRQRTSQTHRELQPFDFSSGPVMIPPGLKSSDVQRQRENKAFMMSWRWKLWEGQREEPFAGGGDPPTRNFGAHQESEWADLAEIHSMHSIFTGQSGWNMLLKPWNYFDRDCSEFTNLLVTPLETTGFGAVCNHRRKQLARFACNVLHWLQRNERKNNIKMSQTKHLLHNRPLGVMNLLMEFS